MNQLFRVLLPSWKFFDGRVDAAVLLYRLSDDGIVFGDWILCIPKTGKRSWKKLFLNTRENYLFAAHALIEYLKNDLSDGSDPAVSLELVKNLVEFQIRESEVNSKSNYFQFTLKGPEYLSPVFEVSQ